MSGHVTISTSLQGGMREAGNIDIREYDEIQELNKEIPYFVEFIFLHIFP